MDETSPPPNLRWVSAYASDLLPEKLPRLKVLEDRMSSADPAVRGKALHPGNLWIRLWFFFVFVSWSSFKYGRTPRRQQTLDIHRAVFDWLVFFKPLPWRVQRRDGPATGGGVTIPFLL
jgi:hypothetical protein